MSKAHEYKFLYVISLSLVLFLSSCVDTSVQNIEASYDFHSLLKVANLVSGSTGLSVTIINNSTNVQEGSLQVAPGTESPAEGQPFMDLPSGSKRFVVDFGGGVQQTFIQTLDSERKYRIYFFNSDSAVVELLKTDLRYTWQQKGSEQGKTLFYPDSAFIGFVNAHTDFAVAYIDITGTKDTTLDLHLTPLENGDRTAVMLPAPGTYNLDLYSPDDLDVPFTTLAVTVAGSARYTSLLYGVRSEIVTKTFIDD